jgi:hypothetical protein
MMTEARLLDCVGTIRAHVFILEIALTIEQCFFLPQKQSINALTDIRVGLQADPVVSRSTEALTALLTRTRYPVATPRS